MQVSFFVYLFVGDFPLITRQLVLVFINDVVDVAVIDKLHEFGVKCIALRAAGYDRIDVSYANKLGIPVVRVPKYSPYAVAEHAVALILCLNRKLHRAFNRVRDDNFQIDGFLGFDVHGKTVGVVGTGAIGEVFARIMKGFGCRLLAYDIIENMPLKSIVEYCSLEELLRQSDIVSLHLPVRFIFCIVFNFFDGDDVVSFNKIVS